MAATVSESEQVVDQTNESILAEEKPADENLTEEQPKEGGMLSHWWGFVAKSWSTAIFWCVEKC